MLGLTVGLLILNSAEGCREFGQTLCVGDYDDASQFSGLWFLSWKRLDLQDVHKHGNSLPPRRIVAKLVNRTSMNLSNFIKGWMGEKVVAAGLWLGLNKKLYRRFHDVVIQAPDGTTQIDHVVISPYGIFVIETKNMQGWIFGNAYDDTWTQTIFKFKSRFQNPLRQNYRHAQCLAEFLELDHAIFHPVIIFIGDCKLKTGVPDNVMTSGLIPYIKGISTPILSTEQIQHADSRLIALKSGKRISRSEHLHSLEVRHSSPICPKCGNDLVKRMAKKGARSGTEFLGCSSYPRCAFTKAI